MKCLKCGKEIAGSVCECGFQLDDDSITTVFPLNEDALMQIYYRENGFIIENGRLTGYCGDTQVQELHIPNGVKGIDFCHLPYVKKVFIPASVEDINCYPLRNMGAEIVVDKGNKWFYSKAGVLFAYGVRYSAGGSGTEVTLTADGDTLLVYPSRKHDSQYRVPDKIACIDDHAFLNARVQHIVLPDSLSIIGKGAFTLCHYLLDLEIPDSVGWISSDWISFCHLRNLSMPYVSHGSTSIPHNIEIENFTLHISNERTEIGENEFRRYSVYDGLPGKKITVVLPKTITRIQAGAFLGNDNLTSILLSENLISIEEYAFAFCRLLSQISFPVKLQVIKECAFMGCGSLKEVTLPPSITHIEQFAFGRGLETLNILTKDVEIDDTAFWLCRLQENHIMAPVDIKKKIISYQPNEKLRNTLQEHFSTLFLLLISP